MAYYNQLLFEAGGGIISPSQQSERENGASIMIGIGGTGCDALRKLKREVHNRLKPDNEDSPVPTYTGISFLGIDSDRSNFKPARNHKELDSNTEFFDISNDHIEAVFENRTILESRKEMSWLSYEDINIKTASDGAGGIRQVGRFLLIDKAAAFEAKLRGVILNAITGNTGDVTIHLMSGLSGGTGSGCFIDVCYLIRKVLHDLGKDNAKILGYFFLPDVNLSIPEVAADPLVSPYIRKNGYAALKELDYLMNLESAKDCFEQDYGTFGYRSQRPPVDLCYLVSSTNSSGTLMKNGYSYCSSVVVDYILSYLSKVTLPKGIQPGDNDGGMTLRGHIANIEQAKKAIRRRHGAIYDYNVIGAANVIMPLSDISTYLGARLFEEFKEMYKKAPAEGELNDFVLGSNLSYDTIKGELTKGVYFSIKFPEFSPKDIQNGNAPVVKVCDAWKEVSYGKFKENSKALLEDMEGNYYVAENPKSLIGKLYKGLYTKYASVPEFGPFYAKRMLYSKENKNFINVLDGFITRVKEAKEAEIRQESLRRSDLEAAESTFKNAKFLAIGGAYKKYLKALERWYLHLGVCEQLNYLENLLTDFRRQAVALDFAFFSTLTNVVETLRDTFAENYKILTDADFTEGNSTYTWKILTIPEVRESLDESVKKMNCQEELRKFLHMLLDNFQEWLGQDENKITKLITNFMNEEFKENSKKTILDYLREKYQVSDSSLLANTICNEIFMGKMDGGSAPLFWKHPLFEITEVAKHCVLSIPFNSAEIEAAAEQYKAGRNEYAIRKTGLQDRLFMTGFYSGVPLYGYQALAELEKAYENSNEKGIHLYENGGVNWRNYLPSPIPASFSMESHQIPRILEKNKKLSVIFEEGMELGCIVQTGEDVELRILQDFDLDTYIQGLGSYESNGKPVLVKCDEIVEKLDEKIAHFYDGSSVEILRILNDGFADSKPVVLKDNFLRFPVFSDKAEREIKKIRGLREFREKVANAKKAGGDDARMLSDFLNAVFVGIINVPNRGGSIKYTYLQFGTPTVIVLQDASMPYGQRTLKLYQAWLTYKVLTDEERTRITDHLNKALNEITDEMYDNAKSLKDRHNPDYMSMIHDEILQYGRTEVEDMTSFYNEFMKQLEVFIRMYM